MRFRYYYRSETGNYRQNNQDCAFAMSLRTACGDAFLGVVCDGMGGLSHGELASRAAVDAFSEWFQEEFRYIMSTEMLRDIIFAQWEQLISGVNSRLRAMSQEMGCQMGTTLSALLLFAGSYYAAQIGDSRIYQMGCDGAVTQLTRDHSLVSDMAQAGLMTENEMSAAARRNVLTRCVGVKEYVCADHYSGALDKGCFLLCSDGFYGRLNCAETSGLVARALSGGNLRKSMDSAVYSRVNSGEKDNVTALAVRANM